MVSRTVIIVEVICSLIMLLFVYAALSKFMDFEQFKVQLGQSPILFPFVTIIAWVVPVMELLISVLLVITKYRLLALYASLSLLVMFTTYILMITHFSDFIPCSCGGVLQNMSWNQHLVFNLVYISLAISGIVLEKKRLLAGAVRPTSPITT